MFLAEEDKEQVNNKEIYHIKKRKKPSLFLKILKFIFKLFFILLLIAMIVGGLIAYKLYGIIKDVKISKEDLVIKHENTIIKDLKGNQLGVLNGEENRVNITLEDMPEYLPLAFIAIEDERFYEHKGVDIKRTLAATYTYIKNKGHSPFGGSSITQQLVKNLTEERNDSWERKVREMAKAYYVEQEVSKEEILELYLNLIFLGDTIYGVEQGSNYYFNKPAKELSLAECAFLAGINHSPNHYNPFGEDNEEILKDIKKRTKVVLNKMNELEQIPTNLEYRKALKEVDDGLKFEKGADAQVLFSYHTDAAIQQIIRELRIKNNWTYEQARLYVSGGGFIIYTTQDPDIQEKMQMEFMEEKYHTQDVDDNGNLQDSQAAMVLIENKTGYVLAISSGFDEKTTAFGFNRATDGRKQTGSSMKPIAVLAPSIDSKIITAATIFDDNPTIFDNGKYDPKNYGYSYRGLITVREAIAYSQNTPMVKTMCLLTPERSIKFLKNVGMSVDEKNDNVLPLALGGLTWGVTPLEMAGAYSVIANDGVYIQPTFYTKVVDLNGNTILQANQPKTIVMSKEAAYVVKEILTQPVKTGTATNCSISGIDVAAKTGTTNNDYDRWLCGFTPYYTGAVWYGHDSNATVKGWAINPAGQIWAGVMQRVHENLEPKTFYETKPEGVLEVEVCKKSGFLATSSCKSYRTNYVEYFVEGTEPIQTCPYHSYAKVCTESGLLATSNCPKTKNVSNKGEYINNNNLWTTRGNYKPKNIPLDRCNIH